MSLVMLNFTVYERRYREAKRAKIAELTENV